MIVLLWFDMLCMVLRCGKIVSPSSPPPPPPTSPNEITTVESEEQLCLAPEEGKVLLSTDSMMRCLEVAVDYWHTMSRTVAQVCGRGIWVWPGFLE